ncbi:MAG TPA: hypothetical protein PKI11_05415 [Candidatus Hydrogenedentes bacterium]|nr:hypothetical protein [Candidatus Hydrogenedentota bacterium]
MTEKCLVVMLLAALIPGVAGAIQDPNEPTWQLRDRYSFDGPNGTLIYFDDNAELRFLLPDKTWALSGAHFSIDLADGGCIDSKLLNGGRPDRTPFEGPFGKGTHYNTHFAPQQGLAVTHRIAALKEYPFKLIEMVIKNTGDAPVTITNARPFVISPGGVPNAGGQTRFKARHINTRGGIPVYSPRTPPLAAAFHFPGAPLCLAFGVLPFGEAESSVEIISENDAWQGSVTCRYRPGITLQPGETLSVPPVFFNHTLTVLGRVDMYYSWAFSMAPRGAWKDPAPLAWTTVADDKSLDDLVAAAAAWAPVGVTHALIPAHWERVPGSFEGAGPRYPKRIEQAAGALRGAGVKPGVTIDPLAVQGLREGWVVQAADGQLWVKPGNPEARAAAVARLRDLIKGGFQFFVVRPSDIPDTALAELNLTRAEADRIAFQLAEEAAAGLPVFPSSAGAIPAELDVWLDAAAAASRMGEYAVTAAPIRFDAGSAGAPTETVAIAMRLWRGVIEFVGRPSNEQRTALRGVLSQGRLAARAVDFMAQGPKLWQFHADNNDHGYLGDAVLAFPGAPAWTLADLDVADSGPVAIWRAADGSLISTETDPVPAAQQLTLHGVTPVCPHPSFMGASGDLALFLKDVAGLSWDERKGVLRGRIGRSFEGPATAYVSVPQGWAFRGGRAGGQSVRRKVEGNRLAFELRSGAADFELEFARN